MTVPDLDSLSTYGGATIDYSPPWDPRYQKSSQYYCKSLSACAGLTQTMPRALLTISSAPAVTTSKTLWSNGTGAAITVSTSATGVYVITFPGTVYDDIYSGYPGYMSAGHTVNLRAGWAFVSYSSGNDYIAQCNVSGITATVYVRNAGSSFNLANIPSGSSLNLWVI